MAKTKIKIVDFGISGVCKGSMLDRNDAGTLSYMAPETLMGTETMANPAMDVWALGIMMYVMLFSRFPFKGNTP